MAARRRSPEELPIEVRDFTPEEIERAEAKLRRRIEEVRALDPRRIRYDDQQVKNAQSAVQTSILEVFGEHSPEYREHRYHEIFRSPGRALESDEGAQACFAEGIPQTVALLEGLIGRLEEKRAEFGRDVNARTRAAFAGLDLQPRIGGVCAELYRDGHYRNAVLDAYIALENFVKEKSRRHDIDGAGLMRTVFSKNNPILAFNDLRDQTDLDEQEGLMHLFEGVALALRNPRAHTLRADTPQGALDYITLLSLLAKRADAARRV